MTDAIPTRVEPDERFADFYREHLRDVSRYVCRRIGDGDAPDVIAQIFTVAWRRFEQVPPPPEARLWLFGVARRVVGEHRRAALRRASLHRRLQGEARQPPHEDLDPVLVRVEAAMDRLRPKDREALRLVAWEGLTHKEAAVVMGCSANAIEHRLRRARQRIRGSLALTTYRPIPARQWRTQP